MSDVAAAGGRVRAAVALVVAYAMALQLLLPAYAQAVAGPAWSSVICSADQDADKGPLKAGRIHCAQCGWDSAGAALPEPATALVRTVSGLTTDLPTPSGVVVATIVGPRLSQGPPRADC